MAAPNPFGMTPASADLGLGDMLQQQRRGETEEERKRRLQQMQEQKLLGMGGANKSLLGDMPGSASSMLFGR